MSDDGDTIDLVSNGSDRRNVLNAEKWSAHENGKFRKIEPIELQSIEAGDNIWNMTRQKDQFLQLGQKDQMECLWTMVIQLVPLAGLVEDIQGSIKDTLDKISDLEDKFGPQENLSSKKEIPEGYSRILTPLSHYPNGDLINRIDFGEVSFRKNMLRSLSSSGLVPVEDHRSAQDYYNKRSDDDHSSLMTRSLFSKSLGTNTISDKPEPIHIIKSKMMNKRVIINVGGERHEVLWKTLEQMPQTRLGKLASATSDEMIMEFVDFYSLIENEFFFDRHPRSFQTILNYYRTGRLHVADDLCVIAFSDDLDYWGISELWLETCCQNKYMVRKEYVEDEMVKEAQNLKKEESEYWGEGACARSQQFLWDLFEKPESSLGAKVISLASVLFVVVSTVAMVINTLPALAGPPDESGNPTDNPILSMLETICITWFTLEYILRFAGAPKKCEFLKDAMNIVDVLAILPFFISLAVLESTPEGEDQEGFNDIRKLVSVFRIMRIMRIFKLARHSTGLQSIAYTLKNSYKELALLVLFMSMGVLVFSSLCYFAEKDDEDTMFVSIPATFWWAVITMTTVGYGDMSPRTGVGMCVGALCAVSGVLVMSLPIPIVVNNFAAFYLENKKKEKSLKRREEKIIRQKEEEEERIRIDGEEKTKFLESSFDE